MKLFPRCHRQLKPCCSMIVAAAGSSQRMGENKLLLPLGGIPVLARVLQAVDLTPCVSEIVIAAREADFVPFAELCKTWGIAKPVKLIVGGKSRMESVFRAAEETDPDAALLAIQDGARPFVTPELIESVVVYASVHLAAAPAVPVKDTIKHAVNGIVRGTPERSSLFAVQTPQVFDAQLFRAALRSAVDAGVELTDDCAVVERFGKEVYLTDGLEENIKITTPLDITLAEAILAGREG